MKVVLAACIAGAAFFGVTSMALPPLVASHFVAGGTADGYMSREAYVAFMALVVFGVPLLLAALAGLSRHLPQSLINVPNRDYWLAPERVDETRRHFARQGCVFAMLLLVFLCFVHWQVVRANLQAPPKLAEGPFVIALVLFLLSTGVWAVANIVHFRRVHRTDRRGSGHSGPDRR